jgi:dihydroorotate dehydrogenase (fumarate)
MDLSTTYLGFRLSNPFMPGASPMTDDLDTVKQLEDAGAAAFVLRSLFEEQITREREETLRSMETHAESFAEARSFFPEPEQFALGPDAYLEQVRRVKDAVGVPVIASLNGVTSGGWLDHARLIEEAGADALELNVYGLATDPEESGEAVERRTLEIVQAVRGKVGMPVAVKLSPYYSSLAHLARRLDEAGADGLVLFNRFYQPDIDLEELEVVRALRLSKSSEHLLRVRLRWLAVLSGHLRAGLAANGGVHTAEDAIKAIFTGADAIQLVSSLMQRGPGYLRTIRDEVASWLEKHEYESLEQAKGCMNLLRCPDPKAYERANYMYVLQAMST